MDVRTGDAGVSQAFSQGAEVGATGEAGEQAGNGRQHLLVIGIGSQKAKVLVEPQHLVVVSQLDAAKLVEQVNLSG